MSSGTANPKLSRRHLGWIVAVLGCGSAMIVWRSVLLEPAQLPPGVKLSNVELGADAFGKVSGSLTITNVMDRRIVVQAQLERLTGGQWRIIPGSQPGPMYVSALWVLDEGETKTVMLPIPSDSDVTYRIGVDYWLRETRSRVWREKLRNVGHALLKRAPPNSGFAVIGGRGGTPIDWAARQRVNTKEWKSAQR